MGFNYNPMLCCQQVGDNIMPYYNRDFLQNISAGAYSNRTPFSKIGYTPTMTTAISDVWSGTGAYPFPTSASQWQLVTVANDVGAVIRGNAEGANQTVLCDAGGTTTTLNDADVDFGAGAPVVEVGDMVIVSPKGDGSTAALTPEWGYVTTVATHTLTFSGGLSSGGACDVARAYSIVNQNVASSGALAVKMDYLTNDFTKKTIIIICGGGTVAIKDATGTNLTETYRVNSLRVIGLGAAGATAGAIQLQQISGTVLINNITMGYTRARNFQYTVPKGKTLYIDFLSAGWALPAKATVADNCRFFIRANREPATNFFTGILFYPYAEALSDGSMLFEDVVMPLKFTAGTDIKMSGIATAAGSAVARMSGWEES
jgi:hypothetical protein